MMSEFVVGRRPIGARRSSPKRCVDGFASGSVRFGSFEVSSSNSKARGPYEEVG